MGFIAANGKKADAHMMMARKWNSISQSLELTMIFLSSATTVLVLLKVPSLVASIVSGLSALLSAVTGYLKPGKRRETQLEASKDFRLLMMRMVRCETEKEYENLWTEYNKNILNEPFVPGKYAMKEDIKYGMSPELYGVMEKKEDALEKALKEGEDAPAEGEKKEGEEAAAAPAEG